MEHLSLPKDAVLDEVDRVPFVARKPYDGGPFLDYPSRTSIPGIVNLDGQLYDLDWNAYSHGDLESLLQEWFFFGFLHEFLGHLFEEHLFKRDISSTTTSKISPTSISVTPAEVAVLNESQVNALITSQDQALTKTEPGTARTCIDTTHLLHLVEQRMKLNKSGEYLNKQYFDHFSSCIRFIWRSLVPKQSTIGPNGPNPNIILSIATSIELVRIALIKAAPDYDATIPGLSWTRCWDTRRFEPMVRCGWCLSDIGPLSEDFNRLETLFYLSKMRKSNSHKTHDRCSRGTCCVRRAEHPLQQTPTHVNSGCQCSLVQLSQVMQERLYDIVRAERIAVARFSVDDSSEIEIAAWDGHSSYIAISHVWEDGLGYSEQNALHHCQLIRLRSLLGGLQATAGYRMSGQHQAFWLDTLCCPAVPRDLSDPHDKRYTAKRDCLKIMEKIYASAEAVLVLDKELDKVTHGSMHVMELGLRVFSSKWLRRLWTLQEGALARRLWIQCADGPFDLHVLYMTILRLFQYSTASTYGPSVEITSQYLKLRSFFTVLPGWKGSSLGMVVSALDNRRVTCEDDEPICLATLLGLEVRKIVGIRGRMDRMCEVWRQMVSIKHAVPRDIIFHKGPQIEQKGYKWAPSTLLGQNHNNPWVTRAAGENFINESNLREDGLVVEFEGCFLSKPELVFNVETDSNLFEATKAIRKALRDRNGLWYSMSPMQTMPEILESSGKRYAIICQHGFEQRKTLAFPTTLALLVSCYDSSTSVIQAQKETLTLLWQFSAPAQRLFDAAYKECKNTLPIISEACGKQDEKIIRDELICEGIVTSLENKIGTLDSIQKGLLESLGFKTNNDLHSVMRSVISLNISGSYMDMETTTAKQKWCVD